MMFERERVYKRRDIHLIHGGQQQGGISTPSGKPYLLLFTGTGDDFGYKDGWVEEGVFLYSGVGTGDMEFKGGNKAIRDHYQDGKDLHVFKQLGDGEVRYLGCFACASWEYQLNKDRTGSLRRAIVFQLIPVDSALSSHPSPPSPPLQADLVELRKRALEAATAKTSRAPKQAKRHLYERTEAVQVYVLARAKGICEACRRPAPFRRADGAPYLEPHHLRRNSDFGPDHPRWVAAVCPNCHREVHLGADGERLNKALQEYLGPMEV